MKGFLPDNLPPIFTSASFWPRIHTPTNSYLVDSDCIGWLSPYDASKRGGQRRIFSLPHPVFVHDQALFIEKHWSDVEALLSKSPTSLSKPITSSEGYRAVHITPHSQLPAARLKAFSKFRFCLVTDVARYYPSIYTHSIPWALNGRAFAKRSFSYKSTTVFGNRLDFITRQAQDRQTVGVAVGPDTSRIIGELILSAVDAEFYRLSGRQRPVFLRHVDDYIVGGQSIEECEKHLQSLRSALREYELDVNEWKTKIVPTNRIFGESWPSEFEREIKESLGASSKKNDFITVLSKIIDRATTDKDDGIVRHVIRKIDEEKMWGKYWDIVEQFLAQCAVQFPHSFDYVARVISWRIRTDKAFDRKLWIEVAQQTAAHSSKLGRDSEVVWALWLIKELNGKITQKLSGNILRRNGPLVLAFMAHAFANGLIKDRKCPVQLGDAVDGNRHSGRFWPLTLELDYLEIPSVSTRATTGAAALRVLHEGHASIIDWNASPKVFLEGDDPNHPPEKAIEDFTSDYDHDDSEDDGGDNDDHHDDDEDYDPRHDSF